MNHVLPISSLYREPIFEGLTLQALLGCISLLLLDGGNSARICGIALLAFWGGATVLIWRHPHTPTKKDIEFVRHGYALVLVIAFFMTHAIWMLRGLE